jgi:hypothetical protein
LHREDSLHALHVDRGSRLSRLQALLDALEVGTTVVGVFVASAARRAISRDSHPLSGKLQAQLDAMEVETTRKSSRASRALRVTSAARRDENRDKEIVRDRRWPQKHKTVRALLDAMEVETWFAAESAYCLLPTVASAARRERTSRQHDQSVHVAHSAARRDRSRDDLYLGVLLGLLGLLGRP